MRPVWGWRYGGGGVRVVAVGVAEVGGMEV